MANKTTSLIHPLYKRPDLWLFLLSIIGFVSYPDLDLTIAKLYFNGEHFFFEENPYIQFVAWLFSRIHIFYLAIFIYLGIRSFYKDQHHLQKKFLFLVLSLALGYGLFTNSLLQDHSFGRPQPALIQEFGGPMHYTPPFFASGECKVNCSFVSSHAAIAFFIFAVAWVREQRIWIAYGCILGVVVGFARMLQGQAFLSDAVFSGWLMWFVCVLIAHKMQLRTKAE